MTFDRFSSVVNKTLGHCNSLQRITATFATKEVCSPSRRPSGRSTGIPARFTPNPENLNL